MKTIFLDIETLPAPPERWPEIEKKVRRRARAKSRSGNSIEKKQEDAFRQTSLSGDFGRILCIGTIVQTPAGENERLLGWDEAGKRFTGDEAAILRAFWELLVPWDPADFLVGHNIFDFDLKFIYQRPAVHRVKPTVELDFRRYRHHPIFDTMREWTKWGIEDRPSLDRLALILGLPSSKTEEVSGAKVYDLYQAGKFQEIGDYCMADVRLTREIYRRLAFAT